MRVYYDTEFLEDGRTIELISIGMVAEDGREYYAVNSDTPWERIYNHVWLMQHVWPSLPLRDYDPSRFSPTRFTNGRRDSSGRGAVDLTATEVKPRQVIANEVRDFMQATPHVELWASYGAYDHVVLCQLWGRMIDLPEGVPMYTHDLQQEVDRLGGPPLPEQPDGLHNALADARHVRVMATHLAGLEAA